MEGTVHLKRVRCWSPLQIEMLSPSPDIAILPRFDELSLSQDRCCPYMKSKRVKSILQNHPQFIHLRYFVSFHGLVTYHGIIFRDE